MIIRSRKFFDEFLTLEKRLKKITNQNIQLEKERQNKGEADIEDLKKITKVSLATWYLADLNNLKYNSKILCFDLLHIESYKNVTEQIKCYLNQHV